MVVSERTNHLSEGQPPWIVTPETVCINVEPVSGARRGRLGDGVLQLLTSPDLLETTEALLPEHSGQLCPSTVTLSMFMYQVRGTDGSCQKVVYGCGVGAR